MGTLNMLGVAKRVKARILQASTSEVYGDPHVHPQTEDYWGNVNPVGPRGVYDEAKRFAEALTMAYHRFHGVNTRIVRIFNTYGPRMHVDDGRVVPNFIKQAIQGQSLTVYGDGAQTRSFCYVSDLIDGIYKLFMSNEHDPVNIGNPVETSILEFAKTINTLTENSAELTYHPQQRGEGDPQRRRPDITRAENVLGWCPQISLEAGLKKTIPYFKEQLEIA